MLAFQKLVKLIIGFSTVLSMFSCSLHKSYSANHSLVTQIISINNSLVVLCEKQINEEHAVVLGELEELYAQQDKLKSIYENMHKQKGSNKDMLKIVEDEIAAIDMMFGEYKDGVGTIPEKHYQFFASYLKQTNVNLQVFLNEP